VVYNWDLADTVEADLDGVLTVGAGYEIRNAQNYFTGPVVSGIYDGAPVQLPMSGVEPAQPIGSEGAIAPSEFTGKEFNVFIVRQDPGSCFDVAEPAPDEAG